MFLYFLSKEAIKTAYTDYVFNILIFAKQKNVTSPFTPFYFSVSIFIDRNFKKNDLKSSKSPPISRLFNI